ncbi:MAG: IPT/TIG domain-containing protein [Dehalococcoidales bacterium]|nr:IPT/TIG domain-containing protein [Dehalococcoidales bacterium]
MSKMKIIGNIAITAIMLSAAAALIPAAPALALPDITLSPSSGSIGTEVTITGTDFASFKNNELTILFDNSEIDASPLTVPESGNFTATFTVPDDAEAGTAYVKVQMPLGGEIVKSFLVKGAEIGLDSEEGAVGTVVTVEGQGFYAGGELDIYYYSKSSKVNIATGTANGDGEFSLAITIPESTAGEHKITAEDTLGKSAEAPFEVLPSITLSAYLGAANDSITVAGSGFAGESDITIQFGGAQAAEDITDKYGRFQTAITIPAIGSGSYVIQVKDSKENWSKAAFTIAAGVKLNQSSGAVGTPLIVSGAGFNAAVLITITYDNTEVATAVSDSGGTFSATFNAPPSSGGNHLITASDGSNTAECVFTMESTAPPVPVLLLPEEGSKSEAMTGFDWEEVTDPSGVIYSLQVATSEGFTPSSIVLEKDGLAESRYTLSEQEELSPSTKEAPHYWRVKATDGAANSSEWSEAGSFYVSSSFTMPAGAKNALIGIGIAAAVFFGFWLGRRTAYKRRA